MDKKTKKEIDDLLQMIQNWKKCDLGYWTEEGPNKWIWDDFVEKITQWLNPYVWRLRECEYLTPIEYEGFRERLAYEITDMRRLLRLSDTEEDTE